MRRKTKRLSLRIWFVVACLFLLLTPTIIVSILLALSSTAKIDRPSTYPINRVTETVLSSVPSWINPTWQSKLRTMLSASGVQVRLWYSNNEIVFSNINSRRTSSWNDAPPPSTVVMSGINLYVDHISARTDQVHFIYKSHKLIGIAEIVPPFTALGASDGTKSGSNFQKWLNGSGGILLWVVSFMAAFSLIMILIGRSFVSKMSALSKAVRKISFGDFEVSLPNSAIREVDDLSTSLIAMKDDLNNALVRREEIENERRMLISSIIHDLRTPIFTILGHLEGMQKGIANHPEKSEQYMIICMDKAQLLNKLISDLFTISRFDSREQPLQFEEINWGLLIDQVLEGYRLVASEGNVALRHRLNTPTIRISGDQQLLTRAVSNLIDNALRYTPSGGYINLCSDLEGHQLLFIIEDSGPGFGTEDIDHVFKPFYRGDKSRNASESGSGLGLAITQRIILAHSGEISAMNAARHGALVTIRLPAV